ncbi:mutS protein -like 4-like [Asbolus verrucosus]|uniref:MutS protein-like 4-like n=1 Tax=Asbolus verrucosus TaxID=1661398 RepID=A0A482VWV2_ASBVE|nr:mutS protein -like 4-like [Asbolus verrucosus]
MGAPNKPAPKRKTSSTPSSATNWGRSHLSTTLSTDTESRIIIALTEGRGDARCEVGMASIDLSLPTLILCQISDAQSYINTLTKINILNPTDIVIPATFLESIHNRLVDKIKKQFPKIKILSAPRKTFNKSNGMDRILQLCLPSINTICVGLQHKYYALAAASALVTYLQNNLNIYYANESLNVNYQESEGYAVIDVSTADRLELVSSTKPTQATRYSSLFGVLNYCSTKIGARLLRSTILQPPCLPAIIEQTTRCVTELIKHPQMLLSIQVILQKISNIDQLLGITTKNFGTSDSCSVRQLNYLLLLNSLIDLIDPLKGIIERCEQPFFKDLKNTLESDKFNVIANQIRSMIHPSAQFLKSEAGINQRCYAIKSGINGLLDLVRKTYSERLNDMTEYVKYLGNKYNLPLTLGNNNTKGYHIVLKLNNQQKRFFKKTDLPPEFIQLLFIDSYQGVSFGWKLHDENRGINKLLYKTRRHYVGNTENKMIHKTMIELKQHIGFFYKLCEDIARLDMLQSLAEASRRGSYVRPKFGEFTELIQARHPMLELLIGNQRVANSISICKDFNIHIITGPNGSGKSIYIRQVILLQVMAQVGCYVPADSAIFRPMSRMFARIYLEDNMEYGASAFILEMKEIKYMMTLLSENSLFIIDELCRSTSADEGTALAMAICEKFCSTSAFVFVTTHYTALANLAHMYLNVKTWQMEIVSSGDSPQDFNLNYKFRLIPGVTTSKHYGVYIVRNIWPESILEENKKFIGVHKAIKLKYKLESDLRKLESRKQLSGAEINKLLNNYQNELQKLNINLDFDYRNAQFGSDFVPCGNGGQELINDEAGSILNFTLDKHLNGCSIFETSKRIAITSINLFQK